MHDGRRVDLEWVFAVALLELLQTRGELDTTGACGGERLAVLLNIGRDDVLAVLQRNGKDIVLFLELYKPNLKEDKL